MRRPICGQPRQLLRASVDGTRLDPSRRDERVDVGFLDPDVLTELGVGDSALVDEPAYQPHGGAEASAAWLTLSRVITLSIRELQLEHRGEDGSASWQAEQS